MRWWSCVSSLLKESLPFACLLFFPLSISDSSLYFLSFHSSYLLEPNCPWNWFLLSNREQTVEIPPWLGLSMLINLPMSSGRQPLICIDSQRTTTNIVSLLQNSGLNSNAHAISCSSDSNVQFNNTFSGNLLQKFKPFWHQQMHIMQYFKWKLFEMLTDANSHFRKIFPVSHHLCSPSKPWDRCRSWHISGSCHSDMHSPQKGSPHWGLEVWMITRGPQEDKY